MKSNERDLEKTEIEWDPTSQLLIPAVVFGIAVETGVVMVVYLHEALEHKLQRGKALTNDDVETAAIEGPVQRLRPKLMTVCAVLASLVRTPWESGVGSDVMKPIATHCRRHDYFNDPWADFGAGLLRDDERTGAEARNTVAQR